MQEELTLINVLPITNELWLNHSLFTLYTNIFHKSLTLTHTQTNNERKIIINWRITLDAVTRDSWLDILDVDKRTAKKVLEFTIDSLTEQGYTVLMPVYVWERLETALKVLNIGRRQSVTRIYCYLYYYAMRFHGSYSHARADMVAELKINNTVLAESLAWLEDQGFIIRTDYSMRENERYSRRYYIPQDDWSAQCKKEWIDLQQSIKL